MKSKSFILFSGTAFEYFEFSIFLFYSFVISEHYFNSSGYSLPLIFVFLNFIGKFIGGTYIASFIDKFGSLKIYKITMFITAASTFLILLLPEYDKIGIFSGILFIFLRFIQVASASADASSAIILSRENFENKAYSSSLISASFIFGCGIANVVSNLVNIHLFKYVIIVSSLILFFFRFILVKFDLKNGVNSFKAEKREWSIRNIYDIFKVFLIMMPSLLVQFELFNFNSIHIGLNFTLVILYSLFAILFSLFNKNYLMNIKIGYFLVAILTFGKILININIDLLKILLVIPYGLFISSGFAIILDNIDKYKAGMIMTMGAAIANSVTLFLLQNAAFKYEYYIVLFSLIGIITINYIGKNYVQNNKEKELRI
ncbi:MFS transporter [Fluviispira multicolorata]|uniref:MFS transporter n=1 Tax=Fluviispira multicolorata TaxID=2654512 RepID=A0A833JCQ2_9BACT|nr:MFS transporter [Fluviispira multicolorata]KAB8030687.1 MFS transporter [Fluviispira multicolorata]